MPQQSWARVRSRGTSRYGGNDIEPGQSERRHGGGGVERAIEVDVHHAMVGAVRNNDQLPAG